MTKRHGVAAALFFVVVLVVGACSSNSQQVQDKIAEQIKKETGVSNAQVTCPKDIKATKGETFSCDASGDFSTFLQSKGVNAKLNHVKFNVTFIDDKSFSADVDTVQLQADLSSQNVGGAGGSSSDSSSSDSGASLSDNPALSSDTTSTDYSTSS